MDLPAPSCLSIVNLMKRDALAKNAKFVLYERNKPDIPAIHRKMSGLGFNESQFEIVGQDLADSTPTGSYDWVNLDTCCSLNQSLLGFISKLNFIKGGELNVWLTYYRSNAEFHEGLRNTFFRNEEGMKIMQQVRRSHPILQDYDPDSQNSSTKLVTLMAIIMAINNYSYELEMPIDYIDRSTTMYFFRIRNIRRLSTPVLPNFSDIYRPDDNFEGFKYPNKKPRNLTSEDDVPRSCILVASGAASSSRAFLTRRMRQVLKSAPDCGKDPKWVRAGWKSTVSRMCCDKEIIDRAHKLIDAA
jgi:hypothetical protein